MESYAEYKNKELQKDIKKTTMKVEINLVALIQSHSKDPKYIELGEKLDNYIKNNFEPSKAITNIIEKK